MTKRTTQNQEPERLSQRWVLILLGAGLAALAVLTLGGAPVLVLTVAGGSVVGLHQIIS
ncbi:hypothetical protein [Streptomyces jumonjinensis]|uniref:hypothetical protein n=1 Tax=Streptomyces jumonjinensis TaxID=1945 RepID=UPI001297B599|nr:hypothetical protein [Streptomyces jumonjinensis]